MGLCIDIGVGGRFHADHLVQGLLRLDHQVRLWSSFPRSRFPPFAAGHVNSILIPELFFRLGRVLGFENRADILKMRLFGRLLAKKLTPQQKQIFIGWSSFSLESLRLSGFDHRAIIRDSSHIRYQAELLQGAYRKLGLRFANRIEAIEREEQEYAETDTLFVLSKFAKKTFVERGIASEKIKLLPLGTDISLFRSRFRADFGPVLKVVYFGSVSVRKGIPFLLEAIKSLENVELTLIGPLEPVLRPWLRENPAVRYRGPMSHAQLAQVLPDYDVFVLPTLEDGFGQTLIQAMACGLVPVVTDCCGAAEHVEDGKSGFVVPPADSEVLRDRIECLKDFTTWGKLRKQSLLKVPSLDWSAYQRALENWLGEIQ